MTETNIIEMTLEPVKDIMNHQTATELDDSLAVVEKRRFDWVWGFFDKSIEKEESAENSPEFLTVLPLEPV